MVGDPRQPRLRGLPLQRPLGPEHPLHLGDAREQAEALGHARTVLEPPGLLQKFQRAPAELEQLESFAHTDGPATQFVGFHAPHDS